MPKGPAAAGANNLIQLFRGGMTAIGPDRGKLVLAVLLAFVIGTLETVLLYFLASLAVALTSSRANLVASIGFVGSHLSIKTSLFASGCLVGALLLMSVPLSRLTASLSTNFVIRMRERVINAYLGSTLAYRSTQREGLLLQLIGEYCQRAESTVQQLTSVCVTTCTLAMVLLGTLILAPKIAVGLLIGLAISVSVIGSIASRVRKNANRTASVNREVVGLVAQSARLSEEISAFDVSQKVVETLGKHIRQAAEALGQIRYEGRLLPNVYQYGMLGTVLLFMGILSIVYPGNHPGLTPLALLLIRALTYVRQILGAVQSGGETAPYIELINTELKAMEAHQVTQNGLPQSQFLGLSLNKVSYIFKDSEPTLQDVTFDIRPGEALGLIGPSGSGKSTLIEIILRLRTPSSGTITTGGIPLVDISPAAWAGISAYVPQDSKLVLGTIADNIRFFRNGFDLEQVMAAARAAHVHEEIADLPEGYDTLVGPGMRGLSGGQRQRLAIARALLAKPLLLVLDEPTSALDQRSEHLIAQTLAELKGAVTIILVAHRPATLGVCDHVLRVVQGCVTKVAIKAVSA